VSIFLWGLLKFTKMQMELAQIEDLNENLGKENLRLVFIPEQGYLGIGIAFHIREFYV